MMHTLTLALGNSLAEAGDPSGYSQHGIRARLAERLATVGPGDLHLVVCLAAWPARVHPHDFVVDAICHAARTRGTVTVTTDPDSASRLHTRWTRRWRRPRVVIEYRADDHRAAEHFARDTRDKLADLGRADRPHQHSPYSARRAPIRWTGEPGCPTGAIRPAQGNVDGLAASGEVRS